MNELTLSYIITTRNKLPYLKEVMKRLLANIQEDEEIVVADGASTDGTVEYLTDLYKQGKIHQFISEPDKGEAHGYNKCLLMARGKLIKIITDDDAFYYPAIQECKKFMLEHEEIDVMSGSAAEVFLEELNKFRVLRECEYNYKLWVQTGNSGWFSGLPLMIRKSSLSLTGLFFPGVILVDLEYSFRITHLNINIAWNTAIMAVRIENPQSNFRNLKSNSAKIVEEWDKIQFFYSHEYRNRIISLMKAEIAILVVIKQRLRPIKNLIYKIISFHKNGDTTNTSSMVILDDFILSNIDNAFSVCDKFLKEYNSQNSSMFLCKENHANQTN